MGTEEFHVTQINLGLSQEEEVGIIKMLRDNVDLLAWKSSGMPGIDLNVVCHQLLLDPASKVMMRRKQDNIEVNKTSDPK